MESSSSDAAGNERETPEPMFVDVGANLLDDMYRGIYRSKPRHDPDLDLVLRRAWDSRLDKIVVTAGTLEESRRALELARMDPRTFSTVGVHPTRCRAFDDDPEGLVAELTAVAREGMSDGTVVAIGEMGLDYARTEFCDVETQKRGLDLQLSVAESTGLPLFVHNRDTGTDLLDALTARRDAFPGGGVVHSFDDTLELATKFIDLGLYIGVNGCSLKTSENLEVVKSIPLDRLLLETDCPWCDIRATHAGHRFVKTTFPTKKEKSYEEGCCVKNRFEPCHIWQVAEVVAGTKGVDVKVVADASRRNAHELFGGLEKRTR